MTLRLGAAVAIALAAATPTLAQPAPDPLVLVTRLLVETRVAAADGTTAIRLVPARHLAPGDRVTVSLAYRNAGRRPIADLVLANPVPRGMIYRGIAPDSSAPELSVDGRSFATLTGLRVRGADGRERAAVAADVTQVRWRLPRPVAAGAAGTVAFQAIVQ